MSRITVTTVMFFALSFADANTAISTTAPPDKVEDLPAQRPPATDIANHIESIFDAYVEKNGEVIERTHTFDWLGFQSRSLQLVRGIEGYMTNARKALKNGRGSGHEMIQIVSRVRGDIAVAPYVARFHIGTGEEAFSIIYRAIDVYRLDGGAWNQCATNICVLMDDPIRCASSADYAEYPTMLPREAVETPPVASAEAQSMWKKRRASPKEEERLRALTLHGLLNAGDPDALGQMRTADWVGFEIDSTRVIERIGEVERTDPPFSPVSGAVLRFETQLYDDVALVFAIARLRDEEDTAILVRTCDLFERSGTEWKQWASHPNAFPDVLSNSGR